MVTFEEIAARYNAGQTDLSNEVKFIMDDPSQGELAALTFARNIDENIGAQAYQKALQHIEAYKLANVIKYNERAAIQSQLNKAEINTGRFLASEDSRNVADAVLRNAQQPIAPIVTKEQNPLVINLDRLTLDKTKLDKSAAGGVGGLITKQNKEYLLIFGGALFLIGILYFITRKK